MTKTHHILLVDDSIEIRKAVSRYLEQNNMRVTSAAGAAEMDNLLKVGHYDLIVLEGMSANSVGVAHAMIDRKIARGSLSRRATIQRV